MIKHFNKETDCLSHFEEKDILPKVVEILEHRQGFTKAITSKRIIALYGTEDRELSARVRKVINYIRNNNIIPCLVASSKGYYIATDAKEITDYEESLRGRVRAIHKMRQSIHQQGIELFGEDAMKTAEEETKEECIKYKLSLKRKRQQKMVKRRKPVLRLKPRRSYRRLTIRSS